MLNKSSSQSTGENGNQDAVLASYRVRIRWVQALPPQADALQRPQEGWAPLEPLIVTVVPLLVVDKDPLFVVVNFLDGRWIPDGTTTEAEIRQPYWWWWQQVEAAAPDHFLWRSRASSWAPISKMIPALSGGVFIWQRQKIQYKWLIIHGDAV